MNNKYVVLKADIVGSRNFSEEEKNFAMKNLNNNIRKINSNFAHSISSDFTIAGGDSILGVINDTVATYKIILELERLMYPVTMRYGIGYGNINFYESTDTNEMDGDAFEFSLQAIYDTREFDLRTRLMSEIKSHRSKINDLLKQIDEIKMDWSEDDYRLYWKFKSLNDIEDVASVEKKGKKSVKKSFEKMKGNKVIDLEKNLLKILKS